MKDEKQFIINEKFNVLARKFLNSNFYIFVWIESRPFTFLFFFILLTKKQINSLKIIFELILVTIVRKEPNANIFDTWIKQNFKWVPLPWKQSYQYPYQTCYYWKVRHFHAIINAKIKSIYARFLQDSLITLTFDFKKLHFRNLIHYFFP